MLIRKREYLALTYFISRALFLGVGFTFMYRESSKDTWIIIILGYLIGNLFIYMYHKISEKLKYNLNNFLRRNTLLSKIYKLIFLLSYLFIILYISVIFTNFVKVYYLFETPIWSTLLLLFIVGFYASKKSEKALIRTGFILFFISVAILFLNSFLLASLTEFNNFLPVFTISSMSTIKSTLVFVLLSVFPNILMLEYKTTLKAKIISYSFSVLVIFIINIFITSVLGEYLITTYSYPEYMVLRRIQFLDFIENIENFASIMWYFDTFILITLALNKTRKVLNTKNQDYILGIILISLIVLSNFLFSHYFSALTYFLENGILLILILLILSCPVLLFTLKKVIKP